MIRPLYGGQRLSKLPLPTPSLTQYARSVLEGGASAIQHGEILGGVGSVIF